MSSKRSRQKMYRQTKKKIKLEDIEDGFTPSEDHYTSESDDDALSEITCASEVGFSKNRESDSSKHSSVDSDESLTSDSNGSNEFKNTPEEHEECEEIKQLKECFVVDNVSQTVSDKMLKILRARLLPQLPKSTKTLLKCDVEFKITDMIAANNTIGEFHYFGIANQLEKTVNTELHPSGVLELMFNSDGFSPFRSSPTTVVPILGKVYTETDLYEPFSIAVYSGSAKPKNQANYLYNFVQELNTLLKTGLSINEKKFVIKIKCFICDTPARAFLKGIVGHTSPFACERCLVEGRKDEDTDNVMVFLQTNADMKSDKDFRNFKYPRHHTGVSLLATVNPPIQMVSQFILDPMHLFFLRVTKRILEYLLSVSLNKARLSADLKCKLHKVTSDVYKDIPIEFPRKMRSTILFSKYKAVEHKFFLTCVAPIVMKKILNTNMYKHLMLLVVGCRMMFSKNWKVNADRAKKYFTQFVNESKKFYGLSFVTISVHNLCHVVDDALNCDCSFSMISAFMFESYLGKCSSRIRCPKNVVMQYCKRQWEIEKYARNKAKENPKLIILKEVSKQVKENKLKKKELQREVKKIKYNNFIYTTQHPDNTVLLTNKEIAVIRGFIKKDGISVVIKKYKNKDSVFTEPCDSSDVHIWKVANLSKESVIIPLFMVERKCIAFKLKFSEKQDVKTFIVGMLH